MDKKEKATKAAPSPTQCEGTELDRDIQLIRVRKCFMERPKTMRQVADELGEERSNICWYIGMLRERGQIQVHHRGECVTTRHIVNYYTTDQGFFVKLIDPQLSLFNVEGAV